MGLCGNAPPMITGVLMTAFGGNGGWNDPSMFLLWDGEAFCVYFLVGKGYLFC